MGRFEGKVVMVTGGARGQGRSHAIAFAKEGASIVVSDIARQVDSVPYAMATDDDLRETVKMVEALDQRCVAVKADCRDTAAMNDAVATAISEFDRIDVLLVNPGCSRCPRSPRCRTRSGTTSSAGPDRGVQGDPGGGAAHGGAGLGPDRGDRVDGRPGRAAPPAHYCAAKWGPSGT